MYPNQPRFFSLLISNQPYQLNDRGFNPSDLHGRTGRSAAKNLRRFDGKCHREGQRAKSITCKGTYQKKCIACIQNSIYMNQYIYIYKRMHTIYPPFLISQHTIRQSDLIPTSRRYRPYLSTVCVLVQNIFADYYYSLMIQKFLNHTLISRALHQEMHPFHHSQHGIFLTIEPPV